MTPQQSRMARAALGWSLTDFAKAAGLGRATLARFELEQTVSRESIKSARSAFEREGIVFIESGAHVGGVVPPIERR